MKLDYGCGSGGFDEILDDRRNRGSWLQLHGGPDAIGVDYNSARLEEARSRIYNRTRFQQADGCHLPFPDGYFDLVHDSATFHHIAYYELAVREIARVLMPGGTLICNESVDNDPLFKVCRRLMGQWRGDEISSMFTSDDFLATLAPYFNIWSARYYWRFPGSDLLRYYNREPRWSLLFNDLVSKGLARLGLAKAMACHFVVTAIRR